jgi:hypothetical protein
LPKAGLVGVDPTEVCWAGAPPSDHWSLGQECLRLVERKSDHHEDRSARVCHRCPAWILSIEHDRCSRRTIERLQAMSRRL